MPYYEKYPLSHVISVQEIVSANKVFGPYLNGCIHMHQDAWEVCCCLQGNVQVIKGSQIYKLDEGQVLFIPPERRHVLSIQDKDTVVFVVSFTCSSAELLRPLQDGVVTAGGKLLPILENLMEELSLCFLQRADRLHLIHFIPNVHSPFGSEQLISSYREQFIIMLLREVTMAQGQVVLAGQFKDAIANYLADQVLDYIRSHIMQPLSVGQVAADFHYSRTHLNSVCSKAFQMSVGELISTERIRQAKRMLMEGQKSVGQIAQELGFSSAQYFSHKFRQVVGCPPSEYAQTAHEELL